MSDYSGESCDDSDLDPDFEAESNESGEDLSPEDDVVDEEDSNETKRNKRRRSKKNTSPMVVDTLLKFETRCASPSVLGALDLSESDSSTGDETFKNTSSAIKTEDTSSYFSSVDESKSQNTDYDFSHILALQSRLSKAREEHEKEKLSSKPQTSGTLSQPSISELLAIGEKNSSLPEDSLTESEEENEPIEPKKEVVQVILENPMKGKVSNKIKKRTAMLEKHLQLIQKENQLLLHKIHVLCLLAHGLYVNSVIINNDTIYGCLLSLLPDDYGPPQNLTSSYIKRLLIWFRKKFEITRDMPRSGEICMNDFESLFSERKNYSVKDLVILFVSLLRGLGLKARFVYSLQPLSLRPKRVTQRKRSVGQQKNKEKANSQSSKQGVSTKKASTGLKSPPEKSKDQSPNKSGPSKTLTKKNLPKNLPKKLPNKGKQIGQSARKSSMESAKTSGPAVKVKKRVKVLSSDSEEGETETENLKSGVDFWVEVYIEKEEKWICADVFSSKVDCSQEIYARCTQPVAYIIAWLNDNTLKDVTRRYVPTWHITSKKNRVDQEWFDNSIRAFRVQESIFDKVEEQILDHDETQMKAPIPTKISDLKNHPLYALKRHLLKFEGIYPPDAVPLGYIRGEAVYSRFCVQELYSREKWIRQGKCVKVKEEPYKIVKSRSKNEKFIGTEKPLELFGHWQVVDYVPPPVVDGKIPRNEYGNIEIYKPSMLPVGTVHLQVPGILRIAKKMNIDCAPAVIGWEHHAGRSHPIIDGAVVCKEFQETLLDAWCAETDASSQRSDHKRKQNSLKKWLKFVKHELIKVHLKRKYNFGDPKTNKDENDPPKKGKNT